MKCKVIQGFSLTAMILKENGVSLEMSAVIILPGLKWLRFECIVVGGRVH